MKNSKIKLFEVQQVQKMRAIKQANNIPFKKDKFYTGDFVKIDLKLKNLKGEEYTKTYMTGIVVKGNTKHTSADYFQNIDSLNIDNCNQYDVQANDYIVIGSIINASNRVSMKILINQPNIMISVVRPAKRSGGSCVKGSGRNNVQKQFMDDDISISRLKKMFKNTLTMNV